MLRMGASMKTIQKRLGHADYYNTGSIYAHVGEEFDRDAADKINGALKTAVLEEIPAQSGPRRTAGK